MNACQLNEEQMDLFKDFIPVKYMDLMNNQAAFGFYDDETIWGAAIVSLDAGKVDILSIFHRVDVEDGACEKALGDLLECNASGLGIYQAEYVAEGTDEELKKQDVNMVNAGFWPCEGEVERYISTLGRIKTAQEKNIKVFNSRGNDNNIILAGDMPESLIRKYNAKHPEVPFLKNESEENLTYFYIKDNEPIAVIMVSENDEGCLVLDWLDRDEKCDSIYNMYLAFECLGKMIEKYSEDKKVLIHPFDDEVVNLIKSFDFEMDTDKKIKTRIYTRYFDI